MHIKDILDEITIEDLQEQHRAIAENIGIYELFRLSECYGGTQLYIPMVFELQKDFIYRKVLEEYSGDNIQQLALKYRISESTVYRLVKEKLGEKRKAPYEGQLTIS